MLYIDVAVEEANTSVARLIPIAVYAGYPKKATKIPAINVTADAPISPVIAPAPNPEINSTTPDNISMNY